MKLTVGVDYCFYHTVLTGGILTPLKMRTLEVDCNDVALNVNHVSFLLSSLRFGKHVRAKSVVLRLVGPTPQHSMGVR